MHKNFVGGFEYPLCPPPWLRADRQTDNACLHAHSTLWTTVLIFYCLTILLKSWVLYTQHETWL